MGIVTPGARAYRVQPKLVQAVLRHADQFRFVGDWVGAIHAERLQQFQENDGAIGNGAVQSDLLPGLLAPCELGLFDKESLVLVPSGDLDAVMRGDVMMGWRNHPRPPEDLDCRRLANLRASMPMKTRDLGARTHF